MMLLDSITDSNWFTVFSPQNLRHRRTTNSAVEYNLNTKQQVIIKVGAYSKIKYISFACTAIKNLGLLHKLYKYLFKKN